MIRPAVIAAASFTAGWLARCELERRRRGHTAPFADRLRSAFADGNGWTLAALRRCLDAAEADDTADTLVVRFSSPHGGEMHARMERGQDRPELLFLGPSGDGWVLARLDAPDDAGGAEGER